MNLFIAGFVSSYSGLHTEETADHRTYYFSDLELRTDEATSQTPVFHLTGNLAIQLNTVQLTAQSQLRVYFRLFSREYTASDGTSRKYNDVCVWKIEVLDENAQVCFTCRK